MFLLHAVSTRSEIDGIWRRSFQQGRTTRGFRLGTTQHDAERLVAHVTQTDLMRRVLSAGEIDLSGDRSQLVRLTQHVCNRFGTLPKSIGCIFVQWQLESGGLQMVGQHIRVLGIDNGMFG